MTGKSGRGTARQTMRVDEDLWNEFGDACAEAGTDRSTYMREVIKWALGKPKASAPKRLPKLNRGDGS